MLVSSSEGLARDGLFWAILLRALMFAVVVDTLWGNLEKVDFWIFCVEVTVRASGS